MEDIPMKHLIFALALLVGGLMAAPANAQYRHSYPQHQQVRPVYPRPYVYPTYPVYPVYPRPYVRPYVYPTYPVYPYYRPYYQYQYQYQYQYDFWYQTYPIWWW
jgi:hypothetical protein